jgi:hypothetical protein
MADISLTIDGEVRFQKLTAPKDRDCLLVDLSKDLEGGAPYSRDRIYFHGSVASFREFAYKMLAALPAEPEAVVDDPRDHEPECTCEQTDVDQFDARGCALHDPNSAWNRAQPQSQALDHAIQAFAASEEEAF